MLIKNGLTENCGEQFEEIDAETNYFYFFMIFVLTTELDII